MAGARDVPAALRDHLKTLSRMLIVVILLVFSTSVIMATTTCNDQTPLQKFQTAWVQTHGIQDDDPYSAKIKWMALPEPNHLGYYFFPVVTNVPTFDERGITVQFSVTHTVSEVISFLLERVRYAGRYSDGLNPFCEYYVDPQDIEKAVTPFKNTSDKRTVGFILPRDFLIITLVDSPSPIFITQEHAGDRAQLRSSANGTCSVVITPLDSQSYFSYVIEILMV